VQQKFVTLYDCYICPLLYFTSERSLWMRCSQCSDAQILNGKWGLLWKREWWKGTTSYL